MKTIEELNQKWYWRLVKVFFFFIVFVSIIWIFAWSYSIYHTYNPKDAKIVEQRFEKFKEKFNNVIEINKELKVIYPDFSINNLLKISEKLKLDKKIPWVMLLIILSEYPDANTYWKIESTCWWWYYNDCWTLYYPEKEYYDDLRFDELNTIFIPRKKVDEFKRVWYLTSIENIISFYNSYKNWGKTYQELLEYYWDIDWIWWYEEYFPYEYFSEYDYRWLNEWIKIIFSFLWFIILFLLFLFFIRWITYYIILWKFNPPEK